MRTIRAGVVGVGHLGYHHARHYAAMEHVELVGIVDANPERAAEVADEFCPQGRFTSLDQLIDAGIDAASIAVPTSAHHDTAMTLIEAGADLMVEKPIAGTLAEAEAMSKAAAHKDCILQVGHIERFNGAVTALFGAVQKPRFIECHRLSPYPMRGQDVSVVLDLMIHDIEIVRALDNSPIASLDAAGVAVFSKTEDIANARLRFESGCVANLTASRVSMDRMRKIRIFEEDAYMSTDYSEQEVRVYRKRKDAADPGASPMDSIQVDLLPVEREEPLKLELASFVECVRERKRPVVSGEDAAAALALAEQILAFIHEHY